MDDVTKRFFEVLDKVGISGASLCKEIPNLTQQRVRKDNLFHRHNHGQHNVL